MDALERTVFDMLDRPALEIAAAVRGGRTRARDLAEAAIARVQERNPILNAIVDFDPSEARRAADEVDRRRSAGLDGSLLGVPFTVKDTVWVGGRRVTQGSLVNAAFKPPRDAVCVERMKAAGGVFLGMTNSPEFAAQGFTENKVYGLTRHPQNPELTSGGSSGGAASGLGAGFSPIAIGTDGGGSGRRPASHVGAVGFKPSAGAIPSLFGFAGFYGPLHGVVAPMGRTVADVRLAFGAMAGPDARDPMTVQLSPLPPPLRPRVAFSPRLGLDLAVDPDVAQAVSAAVERLKAAGWNVTPADPDWPADTTETAFAAVGLAAAANLHGERFRQDPAIFTQNIASMIERGLSLPAREVAAAHRLSDAVARSVAEFFTRYDFLLTPTTACVAWPADQVFPRTIEGRDVGPRGHAAFTPLFNQALVPAISIPCGSGRDGLPVGLQIIGARLADAAVLEMAARAERALSA
jgi:aspartyl-tRNA(Asn)/glutamyl-tRNA(Gln) amidotransferase subunit A